MKQNITKNQVKLYVCSAIPGNVNIACFNRSCLFLFFFSPSPQTPKSKSCGKVKPKENVNTL